MFGCIYVYMDVGCGHQFLTIIAALRCTFQIQSGVQRNENERRLETKSSNTYREVETPQRADIPFN